MYLLFVILMVIAALLMCFIVLIQNSKGGGLASGFSSSNAIMGVRKTTDFLEKATWGLAIFMVIMSIATAYVVPHSSAVKDAVLEQALKEQQTNPYNLPAGTASPQTEAPAAALELADGRMITGKTTDLLGPCAALLLKALKELAGIPHSQPVISPAAIEPIQTLKTQYLGSKNPRLHMDEVLIALSVSAASDPNSQ